jgi:Spy/CpxP family protein refolding chaperone
VNYWKVILATVVIFGAGVLTGGLLVDYIAHSHSKNPHRPQANAGAHPPTNNIAPAHWPEIPPPRLAEIMGKRFVQQLNDTLQLTPEQRVKIEKIIADGQDRNHELWTNVAPKMRAVMQEVNQQIRAELTPEQLKPFEELLKHPPRRPSGTNAPPVSPEQRIQKIEAERLRAMSNASPLMPPPPTNAPGA